MVKLAVNSIVSNDNRPVEEAMTEATPDAFKTIIFQQADHITKQANQIKQQGAIIDQQSSDIARVTHLTELFKKAIFGQKSERIIETDDRQGLFDELLKEVDELNKTVEDEVAPDEDKPKNNSSKGKGRKRRSLEDLIDSDLPEERTVIDLAEDKKFGEDGTPLVKIGEDEVKKLAFHPGYWFFKIFVYPKYANKANPNSGVKRAFAPDFAIPGGSFDESFYANLIYSKCSMHLPFYRLEEDAKANGINLSRQTMSSSFIAIAGVLKPIIELMKISLLERNSTFTDDTSVKLLAPGTGKTKKVYIWVYVAGGQGPPYRIFEFSQTRSGNNPKKFLKEFKGFVHCDAFSGYDILFIDNNMIECGCWMHVRRKFFEAHDAPVELRNLIIRKIRNLYLYEKVIKQLDPATQGEIILRIRHEKIAPIIDEIFSRTAKALTDGEVLPKANFAKAINYMHNLGQALKNFLDNPYLQPDNGESERALRPMTIGRKNWLFFGSEKGAEAMGILMSIVQTCRRMEINVREYLEDVMRRINGHPHSKLHELLPGNWEKADSYYIENK